MQVPIAWLSDFTTLHVSVNELIEALTIGGLEVEKLVNLSEDAGGGQAIDIDILPNMARCMSVVGVAKEAAALLDSEFLFRPPGDHLPPEDPSLAPTITSPEACSQFLAVVIEGTDSVTTPKVIQQRLIGSGIRPINGLVDLANYAMVELGQPLHLYDLAALPSARLGVRLSREGEGIPLISDPADAPAVDLPLGIPVITNADDVAVTVAGVVGGRPTAVSYTTEALVLEAATFDFLAIRRAQHKLAVRTDASARFSRGVPPEFAARGARRFIELLLENAPGAQVRTMGWSGIRHTDRRSIKVSVPTVERMVGVRYQASELAEIFDRLDMDYDQEGEVFTVQVAGDRQDLAIPEDVVEEIVRVGGLERIPATFPIEPAPSPVRDMRRESIRLVGDALVVAGLSEIVSYTLSSRAAHDAAGIASDAPLLPLLNPMSPEHSVIRRSLVPGLLEAVAENITLTGAVHLFEIGVVVLPEKESPEPGLYREEDRLAFAMTGLAEIGVWTDTQRNVDFLDAKDAAAAIPRGLHVEGVEFESGHHSSMAPQACAALVRNGATLGHVGRISPSVAAAFKLPSDVYLGDIDLQAIIGLRRIDFPVLEPPRYPSVKLDVSVVVSADVPTGSLLDTARRVDQSVIDVELFDMFSGGSIEAGRHAVGLRLVIQTGRTLTTREAEEVRDRVIGELASRYGATQR